MFDPDGQNGDWYGWVTNQCGHIVLGLAIATLGLLAGWPWLVMPVMAAALYFMMVEWFGQGLALWRDSIMDTVFVMVGVSYVAAMDHGPVTASGVLSVGGVMLGFGAWKRSKD